MPSSWLRASTSLSCPWPERSWRKKSKPVDEPSAGIGGMLNGKTMASLICEKAPMARPMMALADWSGRVRSSQCLSCTNDMPMFWP